MDSLLDNYNSHYTLAPDGPESLPQPGEDNFLQENMLYENYIVYSDGTLNLAAPVKATNIKWAMFDPETDEEVPVKLMTGFSTNTTRYVLYAPESNLQIGKTYQLSLKVLGPQDVIYRDTCEVAIVKTYHTSTGTRSIDNSINSNSARTIVPSTPYTIDDLQFWLFYTVANDNSDPGKLIKIDLETLSSQSGKVTLDLPPEVYVMKLYALPKTTDTTDFDIGAIELNSILQGIASADLRYVCDVNFVLESINTVLTGTLDLKIYTTGWDISDFRNCIVTTSITNSANNAIVRAQSIHLSAENLPANSAPSNYNFSATLDPGTYIFSVIFDYKGKQYEWSDRCVILSLKSTSQTIGIPLVINQEDSS